MLSSVCLIKTAAKQKTAAVYILNCFDATSSSVFPPCRCLKSHPSTAVCLSTVCCGYNLKGRQVKIWWPLRDPDPPEPCFTVRPGAREVLPRVDDEQGRPFWKWTNVCDVTNMSSLLFIEVREHLWRHKYVKPAFFLRCVETKCQ